MRVDFYQLTRDPAEAVLPPIARNTLAAGERLLVVSADPAQRKRIGEALWKRPDAFLAHGEAGEGHEDRQPILLSGEIAPANGARFLAIADGLWREGEQPFERTFFLFGQAELQHARDCWRSLSRREGAECHYWEQQGGKWLQKA